MASFVTTNNKTKVIVLKKGYPTRCKTFLKKSDGIIWARKVESEMERGLFEDTAKGKTLSKVSFKFLLLRISTFEDLSTLSVKVFFFSRDEPLTTISVSTVIPNIAKGLMVT